MTSPCEVKQKDSQPVLSIRTTSAADNLQPAHADAYARIAEHLQSLGEHPSGPTFTIYYTMDMDKLDIEMGFSVAKELPGKGDIRANTIAAAKVATCIHTGPYTEIGESYNTLSHWLGEQGLEATGISYEFYLNDPLTTAPEDLETRIEFPLKAV